MNSSRIWIAGRDTNAGRLGSSVFYSSDGGETWTDQGNTALTYTGRSITTNDRFNMFCFITSGENINGWVAGGLGDNSPVIWKTSDGATWTESFHSGTISGVLGGISFYDTSNGIAVGENGLILVTANGGTTWAQKSSGVVTTLYKVKMTAADTAFAAGANGVILKTTNGGSSWTAIDIGVSTWLYALEISGKNIWVGGEGGKIYFSGDSGSTWTTQDSHTNQPINSIRMFSGTYGWAACGATAAYSGALLRTTTGGN
ncbi:MAG: YCF48-related protein [Candidatus Margulisiibacteriota bacterium]